MYSKLLKISVMMALCLAAAACTSSKSSNSGPETPTTTTMPPQVEAPVPPGAATDRSKGTTEATEKAEAAAEVQSNTGSDLSFDTPASEQEIANMANVGRQYSGAAPDGLRDYLIARAEQETDGLQRVRNLRFATSIITVQQKLTPKATRVQIVVRMLEPGKPVGSEKEITFSGAMSSQKQGNKIALISKGKDGKPLKTQSGTLICMDASRPRMQFCQTRVAELQLNKAVVQVILRSSIFDLHADFLGKTQCQTNECEEFYALFKNTADNVQGVSTIESQRMETFEIIQGRSAFHLMITTKALEAKKAGEALKFVGPLANPKYYQTLDTKLDRDLTKEEMVDPVTKDFYKTKMSSYLSAVHLKANDGYGNLVILAQMPVQDNNYRDEFEMQIHRDIKPILALLDESLPLASSSATALKRKVVNK
jgi:hypothetical protein